MNAADIARIDSSARARFTYVSDGVIDTWRSYAADVVAGRAWQGDCDDLASTVLDLLGQAGVPLDQRFRILCSTKGSASQMDHMVAAVADDDGRLWVVGDTFAATYPAEDAEFIGIDYNRLDERDPVVWRKGVPWVAGEG